MPILTFVLYALAALGVAIVLLIVAILWGACLLAGRFDDAMDASECKYREGRKDEEMRQHLLQAQADLTKWDAMWTQAEGERIGHELPARLRQ